jgi:hypothetical protein
MLCGEMVKKSCDLFVEIHAISILMTGLNRGALNRRVTYLEKESGAGAPGGAGAQAHREVMVAGRATGDDTGHNAMGRSAGLLGIFRRCYVCETCEFQAIHT